MKNVKFRGILRKRRIPRLNSAAHTAERPQSPPVGSKFRGPPRKTMGPIVICVLSVHICRCQGRIQRANPAMAPIHF